MRFWLTALVRKIEDSKCCQEFATCMVRSIAKCRDLSDNRIMQEAITRDPEVMHGTPVFRGIRVPVQTMFDYIENGDSLDEFLEGFPTISRDLAVQVLEECKELRLARV